MDEQRKCGCCKKSQQEIILIKLPITTFYLNDWQCFLDGCKDQEEDFICLECITIEVG